MIDFKKALKKFNAEHPDLTVVSAAVYDGKHYIVVAKENPNEDDYNDPFYLIDGMDARIYKIVPMENIKKVYDAFNNHEIDLNT